MSRGDACDRSASHLHHSKSSRNTLIRCERISWNAIPVGESSRVFAQSRSLEHDCLRGSQGSSGTFTDTPIVGELELCVTGAGTSNLAWAWIVVSMLLLDLDRRGFCFLRGGFCILCIVSVYYRHTQGVRVDIRTFNCLWSSAILSAVLNVDGSWSSSGGGEGVRGIIIMDRRASVSRQRCRPVQ